MLRVPAVSITLEPGAGPLTLELTGPAVREFLSALLDS